MSARVRTSADTSTPRALQRSVGSRTGVGETVSVSSGRSTLDVGDLTAFVLHEQWRAGAVFHNRRAVGQTVDGLATLGGLHEARQFSLPCRTAVTRVRPGLFPLGYCHGSLLSLAV